MTTEPSAARIDPGDEVYVGEGAYGFALEVICGLRSPLVGESEVLGQFRAFCGSTRELQSRWGALRDLCTSLLTDAKSIRATFLSGLGRRSYGGLTRRHLRGHEHVVILGAGKLAQEIVAALHKVKRVDVVCRSRTRGREAVLRYPDVALLEMNERLPSSSREAALVVAAPMTADAINQWAQGQELRFGKILDLRGEAAMNPLVREATTPGKTHVLQLAVLLTERRSQEQAAAARVAAARRAIARRARAYAHRAQLRPFGWEDLCA